MRYTHTFGTKHENVRYRHKKKLPSGSFFYLISITFLISVSL